MRDVNSRVRYLLRDLTRGGAFSFTRNARNFPFEPTFFRSLCKDAVVCGVSAFHAAPLAYVKVLGQIGQFMRSVATDSSAPKAPALRKT